MMYLLSRPVVRPIVIAGALVALAVLGAVWIAADEGRYRHEMAELPAFVDPIVEAMSLRPSTLTEYVAGLRAQAATEEDALRASLIGAALADWTNPRDYTSEASKRELLRMLETAFPEDFTTAQRSALVAGAVAYSQQVIAAERDAEVARLNALLTPREVPTDLGDLVGAGE